MCTGFSRAIKSCVGGNKPAADTQKRRASIYVTRKIRKIQSMCFLQVLYVYGCLHGTSYPPRDIGYNNYLYKTWSHISTRAAPRQSKCSLLLTFRACVCIQVHRLCQCTAINFISVRLFPSGRRRWLACPGSIRLLLCRSITSNFKCVGTRAERVRVRIEIGHIYTFLFIEKNNIRSDIWLADVMVAINLANVQSRKEKKKQFQSELKFKRGYYTQSFDQTKPLYFVAKPKGLLCY